jgi:hypothetical protein
MKKHRVIVSKDAIPTYEANGYQVYIGPDMFDGVPEEARAGLVPMWCPEVKAERLSQLPKAYRIVGSNSTRIDRQYRMEEVELMERDEFSCYIGTAEGADYVNAASIYEARRECAAGEAWSLRETVRLQREAADAIEDFMVRIECPPEK